MGTEKTPQKGKIMTGNAIRQARHRAKIAELPPALPDIPRLCLVCPLSDCFQKSKGCLQRAENRSRGKSLLDTLEQREKRFGYE
ncbi:MAG: hypothetical protein VST70_05090 [Nitrospirota bacterium]|nr:hypothetical protein [Nitrospirota bacterium]